MWWFRYIVSNLLYRIFDLDFIHVYSKNTKFASGVYLISYSDNDGTPTIALKKKWSFFKYTVVEVKACGLIDGFPYSKMSWLPFTLDRRLMDLFWGFK